MNRIPKIAGIVCLIFLFLYIMPIIFPNMKKKIVALCMTGYTGVILYLTLLTRLVNFQEIYLKIFNLTADPDIYATPEVGKRGSEWSAEQRGIHGLALIKYSLSDPNSVLYIIPSFLMNLFLFMPYGMMFRCIWPNTIEKYKRQCIFCAVGVLIIELLQFFFSLGQFDLLDIVSNTLGFFLGLKIYDRLLTKRWGI